MIQYYDIEVDEAWWLPAHPGYEHDHEALWLVARLPGPPGDYPRSWPEWAAELSVVELEEFEEEARIDYVRAFWLVWRNLEWLPCLVAPISLKFVRTLPGRLAALYLVHYAGFRNRYPVYITYGSRPFHFLKERSGQR